MHKHKTYNMNFLGCCNSSLKRIIVFMVESALIVSVCSQNDYLAGSAGSGQSAIVDGIGTASSFSGPSGIAFLAQDVALVSDWSGNSIRLLRFINSSVINVSTVAGMTVSGYQDGRAANARFNNPAAICALGNTAAFISDYGNLAIRKLDLVSKTVTTLVNNSQLAKSSRLRGPRSICLQPDASSLYIADVTIIYRFDLNTGQMVRLAGSSTIGAFFDGVGTNAYFAGLMGMAMVPDGSRLIVTDVFVQVRDPAHTRSGA